MKEGIRLAGKNGYIHSCEENKISKMEYLLPLSDSGYSPEEINRLWDFYVTKTPAAATKHSISLEQRGWESTQDKEKGYPGLITALEDAAGIDSICFVRATSIKDTLSALGLSGNMICFAHPRAVMKQDASISITENEELRITNKESVPHCLLRHIRNAFAHGGTYFYEDMILLEDYDGKTQSASILLRKETLLKWMDVIDKREGV